MEQFAVVWDGRRNGPGGAQLCVPDESRVIPTPREIVRTRRDALLTWDERLEVVRDVDTLSYRDAAAK